MVTLLTTSPVLLFFFRGLANYHFTVMKRGLFMV